MFVVSASLGVSARRIFEYFILREIPGGCSKASGARARRRHDGIIRRRVPGGKPGVLWSV